MMKFEVRPYYIADGQKIKQNPFKIEINNYDELFDYGYDEREIEMIKTINLNEIKKIEVLDMVKSYQEFKRLK